MGHEGRYEVSDQGRVRSLDRIIDCPGPKPHRRSHKGRILRAADDGHGYQSVTLDWKRGAVMIHKLVLEAFVGPKPEGCEARHLDDVRSNNVLSNLAWGTQSENWQDARRNGRRPTKVADNILQFQAGREAAMAGKMRDRRRDKDWLEGWDQVSQHFANEITKTGRIPPK